MAHSILGDEEERNNLFDFDGKKFLHDYPGRVVDEVKAALNQIETARQVITLPYSGALRLATAPFAPAFQTLYRQAGNVLAPLANRQQQAFVDSQNELAERFGLPTSEYEPVTGEQLAAPIAAAGSLLRGKLPTWFSPARRAVTTAPQQKGDLNYWLGRFKQEKGATAEARQLGLVSTQGEATESLLSAAPGTLTKEEALNFIEPIELTETVLLEGGDYGEPIHADDEKLNLPGGTNLKEILVQLPMKPMSMDEFLAAWDRPPTSSDELQVLYEEYLSDFEEGVAPGTDETYTGGHYTEPNVLVHIRTNERIVDGKKTLHIEEIQSDWHQQGQKKGYAGQLTPRDIRTYHGITSEDWELMGVNERAKYENLAIIESPVLRNKGVLDAPYKKTWHELGWKRAFMEALRDPSIEQLTWTTGDVQADRYDLSKEISEVHLSGSNFVAYDHDGNTVIKQTGVRDEDLADLIGKDVAEKLLAQPRKGTLRSLTGQDLKIGGEWHKQLYDQKITKFSERFLKPFGVEPQRIQGKKYWEIFDIQTGKFVNFFDTEEEAKRHVEWVNEATPGYPKDYRSRIKNNEDLWKINITPEMREAYAEGVPLAMREDEEGLLGRYA
jgi:hypothetical protein